MRVVFLDDGGVMNDNQRRGEQFQWLVGEYLVPRLGGTPEAWARSNVSVATRQFEDFKQFFGANPDYDFNAYMAALVPTWMVDMCRDVGVDLPTDLVVLANACGAYVTRRVQSAYPGVISAILEMHATGIELHTASGETSADLDGYLSGMGVRHCFGTLYGPDLVGRAKMSAEYFVRVLRHAGVEPERACIVDDSEETLDWAADVGAHTILCRPEPPLSSRHGHIKGLFDLPRTLGIA